MEFFQAPNHRKTIFKSCLRAVVMTLSTSAKSYLPSLGSTNSQYAGTKTELTPLFFICFNAFLMSAGLVAAELLNSPARRSIGLSLTTSWVAEPCFCSFTPACMLMQHNNARKDNTILFINLHFGKGLKILETGIAPFLCILQLYIEQRVCMLPFLLMPLHILLG